MHQGADPAPAVLSSGPAPTSAESGYLGGRPDPMTAADLQDRYRRILRAGAAKMLDALIAAYPAG